MLNTNATLKIEEIGSGLLLTMPSVYEASMFPELTQSLRKRWADSDQFLALIARALGLAFDRTNG